MNSASSSVITRRRAPAVGPVEAANLEAIPEHQDKPMTSKKLNLKAGEVVEVRGLQEILATLDERGCLDSLPFMPEMMEYCGKRHRIFKRADKTCDNIGPWSIRRMQDSVHLEGARCDGAGHDGCEAGCLIFWKEAWLKRSENNIVPAQILLPSRTAAGTGALCTIESILAASRTPAPAGETIYSCQATQVLSFTSFMRWWDLRQYIRDIRSGNLAGGAAADSRSCRWLEIVLAALMSLRQVLIGLFNSLQARRGVGYPPPLRGPQHKTPLEVLDLQPGELVEVRSKDEILATLDQGSKNRGLYFGPEMLHYAEGIYRVQRSVRRIIDEKTGKMLNMKHPCIVLEGVWCQSSQYHRFCPRAIYHYWREGWLKRVDAGKVPAKAEELAETCRSGC